MQTLKTETTDVIYNAAAQSFEAKVTVHEADQSVTYACAIDAPITMSFEDAAEGLATQALRRHNVPDGLRSYWSKAANNPVLRLATQNLRRGLPLGQYGFFRGRAA
ncbi:MAG: hypothetical protein ABJL99_05225 [Aliishimia sp.]